MQTPRRRVSLTGGARNLVMGLAAGVACIAMRFLLSGIGTIAEGMRGVQRKP